MADVNRYVQIIFDGVDNLSGTVNTAGNSLSEFAGRAEAATQPLADFTTSLVSAEAAILAIGATMAGIAVNQAGQFQTAVTEIGTLFNATEEQTGQLSSGILEFSRTSTKSISEINAAVYQAISTGTDYADSLDYVRAAEELATAGRADLGEVTTVLSSVINAYGASAADAADYSDVLFTTVQKGATTIPELASSLAGVTTIAAAAKVPFDDISAALAAVTAGGTSTSESVTQLRALISELINPSEDLAAALGTTSLETDGLQAVMQKLNSQTGGSASAMNELFGSTEAVQAALILSSDSAGNFAGALRAMDERMGNTVEAAERLRGEFESVNQTFKNIIQATFVDAGTPLLDEYRDVVQALGGIFNQLEFNVPDSAFAPLYDGIEGAAGDLTELLQGIAEALPEALAGIDFSGLLDAFGSLSTEVGGLFGDLDLTDAEDLRVAIQALIDGVQALTTFTAGAVSSLQPFITGLAELINNINSGDQTLIEFAGNIGGLATAVNALAPALGTAADLLIVFSGVNGVGGATTAVAKLLPLLANPATGLAAVLGGIFYLASDTTPLRDFVNELAGWETTSEQVARQQKELRAELELFEEAMKGNEKALALSTQATRDLYQAKQDAAGIDERLAEGVAFSSKSYEEQVAILSDAGEAQKRLDEINRAGAEAAKKAADERRDATIKMAEAWADFTDAQKASLTETERATYAAAAETAEREGLLKVVEETTDASDDQNKKLEKEKQLRQEAADAAFKHRQQVLDFKVALEELASDERLQALEFEFNLDLESLKQQGETARAIIDSIGTTIQSTGETLVGLADSLSGLSGFAALEVRQELQRESDRRDEALELQKQITEAQVRQTEAQAEYLEAKTDALASGDAAIQIDGQGLQPHLEAFMWEIVDALQVRTNAEGLDMLLGFEG